MCSNVLTHQRAVWSRNFRFSRLISAHIPVVEKAASTTVTTTSMKPLKPFAGFSRAGLNFVADLSERDKTWFSQNRSVYDSEVVPQAKTFALELGELLAARVSGGIEYRPKTNGSICPINNDMRFRPDVAPYRDYQMFKFWEGPTKKSSPMFLVRVNVFDGIGFAARMAFNDVDRWRDAVDRFGDAFAENLDALIPAANAELVGAQLKRVPKPYAEGHPRGDLLRRKIFQVRWTKQTPSSITTPGFADWCAHELERAAPIHQWLVEHVGL